MSDLWRYVPDPACGGCAGSPPSAQFSAVNHICPGTCVDFTNQSSNATGYQWIFPGATPSVSTDVNPTSICYSTPGNYDVTLIATNANGTDTLTLANYITVFPFPQPQGIQQNGDTLIANQGALSYQWYFNGTVISGATDYYYIAQQSGDYNVVATDANGCEVEAVIFNVIAGLAETNSKEDDIKLYPNPATGQLLISCRSEIKTVEIYNSIGELISENRFQKIISGSQAELDVSQFSEGTYWIEIFDGKRMTRKSFVKKQN